MCAFDEIVGNRKNIKNAQLLKKAQERHDALVLPCPRRYVVRMLEFFVNHPIAFLAIVLVAGVTFETCSYKHAKEIFNKGAFVAALALVVILVRVIVAFFFSSQHVHACLRRIGAVPQSCFEHPSMRGCASQQ